MTAAKKLDAVAEKKHLDAIAQAVDPAQAREAYGKWLADQGDPLGAVALAGHARVAMKKREKELLDTHSKALLGPLAPWIEKGWIEPTWMRGFIDAVEVRLEDMLGTSNTEVFRTLLDHPSARLLRDIRISANRTERDWNDNYQPLIDVLVELRRPLALREFAVSGVFGSPCGDVSEIWAAFPQLHVFWAFGSSITLGEIDAPNLDTLRVTVMELDHDALPAIANGRAPKLDSLIIGGMEAARIETLAPILDGRTYPALTTLCFDGIVKADAVAEAVLASPLAKRLKQFSLWNCTLSKAMKERVRKRFPKALD